VKFSLEWLSDFVDVSSAGSPEAAADLLTAAGIAVEGIERRDGDTLLEVDITPNRPDAMNHRGLARELAAAASLEFRPRSLETPPDTSAQPAGEAAGVSVEVPERCGRFAMRVIRGTTTAVSPRKWTKRLDAIGVASHDSIVDATNISLWDLGQPLHAFDADKVAQQRLIVRLARTGERLLCLDGVERELHPEDVVVADAKRVLSIAGVIGGAESAISPGTTRNVLLEAAWWSPVSIRRTARRHGLHTDASHRYERGADIEAVPAGLAIAVAEILAAGGGELAAGIVDVYPHRGRPREVLLRLSRLQAISGRPAFPLEDARQILRRLGFAAEPVEGGLRVGVPSWRLDVGIEEDVIEEILRISGYSRIPSALPPPDRLRARFLETDGVPAMVPARALEDAAADRAREAGLFEAVVYPFSSGDPWEAPFGNLLAKESFRPEPLAIVNALDSSRASLRRLLLPGLLETASRNHGSDNPSIALFEIGRVWDAAPAPDADAPAYESRHFAFVLAGEASGFWDRPRRAFDFFDAKAVAEALGEVLAPGGRLEPAQAAGFAVAAEILDAGGARRGIFGHVGPGARKAHRLPEETMAGEIEIAPETRAGAFAFAPLSVFPPIDADLTLVHAPELTWEALRREILAAEPANLASLAYVERYPVSASVKSTVSLRFRSAKRTLSQFEVNAERDRLVARLQKNLGVTI
jgi:phenylalanyl-tRNA synthetase beta chain